jgi:hypothetical protein
MTAHFDRATENIAGREVADGMAVPGMGEFDGLFHL